MSEGQAEIGGLEERIGYVFRRVELVRQALTHPSAFSEVQLTSAEAAARHNQRLEFLGDAVLGLIIGEALYTALPGEREGKLATARAALICGEFLTRLARRLGLPEVLILSSSEEQAGGREKPSILEDALEAIVGAIYRDSDYPTVRAVVLGWYGDLESALASALRDYNPKGLLNEYAQKSMGNNALEYRLKSHEGKPPHEHFTVEVLVAGDVKGTGTGSSRRQAEEQAARDALDGLQPSA